MFLSQTITNVPFISPFISLFPTWALPALYLLLLVLGASGNAGHGVRLFGSQELFALLGLPLYTIPALLLYLGAAVVLRDVLRGLCGLRAGGSAAASSIPPGEERC